MIAHQAKKIGDEALQSVPRPLPHPGRRRRDRQGSVPALARRQPGDEIFARASRRARRLRCRRAGAPATPLEIPPLSAFDALLKPTAEGREISTTMAFVRILTTLLRDKAIGSRIVPIVPDESRTFGMEGLFRQFGIFSQVGQLYRPQDADQLMYYREDPKGQILQEGINEPGAMASFIAAATSYSTSNTPMIPFYIYYSMFGFQRVGDLAWAAGDMRARGFLIGGTSGPHDAQRRRAAARGRPQPCARLDHPQLRRLRPDLRLRTRGHHPAPASSACTPTTRTSTTTSPR